METKKRKSWFPVDQDHSRVTTVVPLFRQDDDRNLQVALQGDENQQPITVTVSDVLSLSTFSRRAVIDFGNISLTDRPITRYMLVENPHDDNQWVSIERNLPEQEFSMYWIGCEEGNAFGSSSQATCNIQKNIVEPMCIPASGGQCLLSITRNQAPQGTLLKQNRATIAGGGFHYVLHFRVNRAYLLHAAVIGRVLPHTQNRHQLSRPLPPICDTPNIPTWARTPFSELRACESSSYSFRPSARTVVTTNFRQSVRTMRKDKARPDFLPSDRPQWLSQPSCSPPQHRSVSQPPGSDIPLLRTLVVRSPSVGFSSQHSADHCHPPRPSLSPYLRTASQSKNSINGGSNPEKATPDSKLGLDFMNSTAIGFVSPKLIRSPALKGGPLSPNYNRTGPDMVGRFGNIFHPDFACALSEASEYGLTQWLNNVFAPCTAANSPSTPLGMLKGECLIENASYCTAVTQARELLRSSAITGPGQRLEREVDEGKITPVQDISFRVDKGAQRRLVDHLHVNYAPAWLHLALDALNADGDQLVKSGAPHSAVESKGQRMVPLSKKIQTYMFTSAHYCIAQNRAKSFDRGKDSKSALVSKAVGREVPVNLGKNRDTLHNRYAIKRFLILVWLLDRLKLNRVLKFDPCLFRLKSNIKSTADSLLTFSRNFLTGENNLVRHLCTLGARVEVVQTALDEYQWEVTNLAVDLRDGVRLVKLAELLVPRLHHVRRMRRTQREQACPATLMSLVRFPAISRLQKIHNVDLALRTFDQCGNLTMADGTKIDPRDIVDGHREKSLTLLWCLLLRYQVAALVDIGCLNEEIRRLRLKFADTREDSLFSNVPFEDEEEDAIHAKLLLWAASVVRLYDLKVENLDASFADGRAFCLIVHHYLPPVLPRGLIRQVSTSTVGVGLSVPPTSGSAQISWFNLDLFQRKLSALGDVPVLISIKPMIDQSRALRVLPPGIVLASLAYLASRFVQGPSGAKQLDTFVRNYAARIIQFNWRCYKQRMIAKKMRIIRPGRSVLGEALPTLELPENVIVRLQACCRGALARRAYRDLREENCRRVQAATTIQSVWRGYCVRKRLNLECEAACIIQNWWRGRLIRRDWLRKREAVAVIQSHWRRTLRRRRDAALRIQRCWRASHIVRHLRTRRLAAIRIQSVWRGYQARCQVSKTRALRTMSPGPDRCPLFFGSCQLIYSPKYTGIGFQRRLDEVAVYTRSTGVHDSQNLSSNPGRTLISQAEMAIDTLLRSKSITRVLDAVRVLESITHLSTEICYWAVGIEHPGEIWANYRPVRPESPRLHLVFLDLFLAANRSDPQEDILLSAVGVLLNVARHPHLAKQRQLWWRSPTEVDWNSPALVRAVSHLKRPHSYSRCSTGSEQPCGTLAFPANGRRESSVGRDDRNHSTDFPSSVVEALVKILLRTLRARPGTVSLRLFTRTCCLLALICEATPADALPAQSILHVIRHLFSYLSRRPTNSLAEPSHESDPHNRPLVSDTNTTATSECIRPTVRDRALMSLRSKLSSELDWHPRPVKLRPDPLVAVEYLTLIVEGKRKQ
ncbi:unnamed protein product [Calicophoron daubneyi]|uniref:Calponin-homology (CH) domain-containing protein n=1 Tax=Calicophoron daubneyi TaxID=300641 RepID=A0AAV2TN38_CALDB